MKANKYKLKPTKEQREKIAIPFGCVRFVFNEALAKKKQFWDSKVKDARNDFQHKLNVDVANKNHVVSIEDISMSGLSKNHKLARHVLDLGWFDFTKKLQYKKDDRGHYLSKIDRFYPSSKNCSVCHCKVTSLPFGVREWTCSVCETVHFRDENAAITSDEQGIIKLKAEGITVSACGDFNISRVRMNAQTSTKQEAPFIVHRT